MPQLQELQFEAASLRGLRALVIELGGNPDAVGRHCRYDLNDLADAGKPLSFHTYSALLCAAAEETGCPHFGLLLGQRSDLSMLGSLGLLTQHCATVGEAYRVFMRYFNIISTGAVFRMEQGPKFSTLVREPTIPELIPCIQSQDVTLMEAVVATRQSRGGNWRPTGVYLTHEPRDRAIYRRAFRCPVHFNQSIQGISFATSDLDLPLPRADKNSRRVLQLQVEALTRQRAKPFRQRVQDSIKLGLATENCGVTDIANNVAVHTRTLHRKLRAEGTTFTALLEDTRRQLSHHLVSRTGLSMLDISQTLGYSDATAFSRSFRRWFGASPSRWRRQHGALPSGESP